METWKHFCHQTMHGGWTCIFFEIPRSTVNNAGQDHKFGQKGHFLLVESQIMFLKLLDDEF